MAAGDEVGLTEDLYIGMIGRYAAAVEVLTKRIALKDQHIAILEQTLMAANAAKTISDAPDETPPEAPVALQ
jgi:hypothetical protein